MYLGRRAEPGGRTFTYKHHVKRCHMLHKKRLAKVKSTLDTSAPKQPKHLKKNLRRERMLEERYAVIERENRLLLRKMGEITSRSSLDNKNRSIKFVRSLNKSSRKAELQRITRENAHILRRIQQRPATYSRAEWDDDRRRNVSYVRSIREYKGGYEAKPRRRRRRKRRGKGAASSTSRRGRARQERGVGGRGAALLDDYGDDVDEDDEFAYRRPALERKRRAHEAALARATAAGEEADAWLRGSGSLPALDADYTSASARRLESALSVDAASALLPSASEPALHTGAPATAPPRTLPPLADEPVGAPLWEPTPGEELLGAEESKMAGELWERTAEDDSLLHDDSFMSGGDGAGYDAEELMMPSSPAEGGEEEEKFGEDDE